MIAFLNYDLKVAVLIAVFYMFYRLLLSRETFHQVNRVVLLATAVASFILPLCIVTLHKTVVVEPVQTLVSIDGISAVMEEEPAMPLWQTIGIALFIAGMVATAGYTLLSMLKVWGLVRGSEQHPQADGIVVCDTEHQVSPFSWLRYIVLSHDDYEAQDAAVLAHERGHIAQHHTLDLLLVDTLTALQWFNPAMWMLRQDLRAIHEYEADAAVLSQGINMRQYQYLLIQKAVSDCGYSVVNGITHSTLKNRISMMSHKKSSSASLLKLLALVPIVGVALALNAETVNDYVYAEKLQTQQKKVVKKGKKAGQVKINAKTVEVKEVKEEKPAVTEEKAEKPVVTEDKDVVEELVKRLPGAKVDEDGTIKINDRKVARIVINDMEYVEELVKRQDDEEPAEESEGVFDVVEQMPEFPGGVGEMMKFVSMNVKYPEEAMKNGIAGRVVVQFIVEMDGTISHVKVFRKVNDALDAEAVRVIQAMPKWKPGKQRGREVRVKYTMPISFRLS